MSIAEAWRAARVPPAGLHFDNAACSRQSNAVIEAAATHARHEAEVGGYVAAEAATPVLDAGRAAVRALAGMPDADVTFTTGSNHALDLLLRGWPGRRTVACLLGEYGPNLAIMAANGFEIRRLPVDELGVLRVEDAAAALRADPPAIVHLTVIGSHRGVVQPLAELAAVCRDLGLPLVVDAAQGFGHVDCAAGADVVYTSSRKWLAGPRGVGALAVSPRLGLQSPEVGEANIAARIGFSLALGDHLAAGPQLVRDRLAEVGALTRTVLAVVPGWRVVEPVDTPSALTTLEPTHGADPVAVRAKLIAEHGIVTTACEKVRAPDEITRAVLRVSPHVDVTPDELEGFAAALR